MFPYPHGMGVINPLYAAQLAAAQAAALNPLGRGELFIPFEMHTCRPVLLE